MAPADLSKGTRGQALLMVTMGITFLLGVLGLVVDVGYGYYVKQVTQAVDSGVDGRRDRHHQQPGRLRNQSPLSDGI